MSDRESNTAPTTLSRVEQARVVRLLVCNCSSIPTQHLSAEFCHVRLEKNNAIAISYTWGEFDRRDVLMGHETGKPQRRLYINLGQEWTIPDLWQRLAEIAEKCPLWIDQLCIPQKDEEIRLILAKIPVIFRTFHLIALLPGSTCSCLRRLCLFLPRIKKGHRLARLVSAKARFVQRKSSIRQVGPLPSNADILDLTIANVDDDAIMECQSRCYNAIGCCSWFGRIWTLQELTYSETLQVVWNLQIQAACVFQRDDGLLSEREVHNLSAFNRQLYSQAIAETSDPKVACAVIRKKCSQYHSAAHEALMQYSTSPETKLRFLLGLPIRRGRGGILATNTPLEIFQERLSLMSNSRRVATQSKDYALAFWVDCPGYVIPVDYNSMTLGEILEDAMRQLEKTHGMTLANNFPASLAGSSGSAGFRWKPSSYLEINEPQNFSQVYGSLGASQCKLIPCNRDGSIPLRTINRSAVSERARHYNDAIAGWKTADILQLFRDFKQQLPLYTRLKVMTLTDEWVPEHSVKDVKHFLRGNPSDQDLARVDNEMATILFQSIIKFDDRPYPIRRALWEKLPQVDHHTIIYDLIASALGLDPRACRFRDLKVMIALGNPVCLGFTNDKLEPAAGEVNSRMTMCVDMESAEEDGHVAYEIMSDDNATRPVPRRYRVTGIWVPCLGISEEVGAVPDIVAPDAVIT